MKYKILKNLQFYYEESFILVQLNEKLLTNREHIFDIEASDPNFLEVEEVAIKDGKLEIVYQRPEGYTPLIDLKDYAKFYKLDILNECLARNVLKNTSTYLAMTNILVKTTKDLKFIYKADSYDNLPSDKLPELDQWQNFICSLFGKYTLEQYSKNKQKLISREKNPFLSEMLKCESLENLKNFVQQELIDEQKDFFATDRADELQVIRQKKKKTFVKAVSTLACLGIYAGTIFYLKNAEAKEIATVQTNAATEITILNKIIDEDSDSIAADMEKLAYPLEKQVDIYIKLNDYAKAYELDPTADQKIIQDLYKRGKTDEILDLDFAGSDTLESYKKIIDYDTTNDLQYIVQTSNDLPTLEALIDQAVNHQDISMIRSIRSIAIKQKNLPLKAKSQLKMIDTLLEDNNSQLENVYKDDSINDDLKKSTTNDLLDVNNQLLSEKIEISNQEK